MYLPNFYMCYKNIFIKSLSTQLFVSSTKLLNLRQDVQLAKLHTSATAKSKLFLDKENQYAHLILRNSQKYKLFTEPEIEPEQKNINFKEILNNYNFTNREETFENFKFVAQFCKNTNTCISDDRFDKFVDVFTQHCHQLTDEQLIDSIRFMTLLPDTPHIHFKNFIELWSVLDDTCVDRLENWDTDKILLVCDCWYAINLARFNRFVWSALRKLSRKIRKLNAQQIVHSLFFCNIVRKPVFEMFDYEVAFNNLINEMTLNEISVMAMGFFKTKTPIRNSELIEKIFRRLLLELDIVEDITLVNILKLLRYSSKIPEAELMYKLLEDICPQIDRISLLSCLHIALLGCDLQLCHNKCIELIMRRFIKDIDSARLKDMERICHVMSLFNLDKEDPTKKMLCENIIVKLKDRVKEIIQYPKCFPACLHYLTLCGYYDKELISTALDNKFIRHAYGKNLVLGREIFCLDSFTRIQLAGKYDGNQLPEKLRNTMGKMLTHYIPERNSKFKLSLTDKILLDVKDCCDTLFKVAYIKHILPHYQRPVIIICYDKGKKQGVPLYKDCPINYTGTILTKELILGENYKLKNMESIVVVIGGWNNFVRDQNRLTAIFQVKLEQLKLLGHKTIMISWHEWRELENAMDRQNLIRRKLSQII